MILLSCRRPIRPYNVIIIMFLYESHLLFFSIPSRPLSSSITLQDNTYIICITGDHSTPVEYGDHSCEPVPFLVSHINSTLSPDEVSTIKFDEISAVQYGQLGRFPGHQMFPILHRYMNEIHHCNNNNNPNLIP